MRRICITMLTLAVVTLELCTAQGHEQQKTLSKVSKSGVDYRVPEFELKDATFVEGISQLSRSTVGEMHLGVEEVLRDKSGNTSPDNRFSLSLRNYTVREILDTLCDFDDRYTWSEDGIAINVYPKAIVGNESYLLNRKLKMVAVTGITSPEAALAFLDRQMPPPREQLAYAGAGGDSHYDAPWTQTFEDITVREFMNRASEHMGRHTSWIFFGSTQERIFTFRKGGFH